MFTTINNQKIFFSNGNGKLQNDRPNVVFLHGAGMDHTVFVMPARYFARHNYNVYAFDFPGHGRSLGSPCRSIDDIADWLALAFKELNIDKASIVGHSMGSLVGLNFSAKFPEKVRNLALLGTSTPMAVSDTLLNSAKINSHDAIDMANTWSHSNFGQMGGNEAPGICMTMSGQRLLERAKDDVFFIDLIACNGFTNGAELAASIKAKTLIIVGNQDKMTSPINALKVAEIIPNSRVCRLDPCGHSMLSEQPNAVLDALNTIV
jgi:pimeloyl-ACP methyl ester carboxylesterase